MKNSLLVCISLSVLTAGLMLNQITTPTNKVPAAVNRYWLKHSKKELLRDKATNCFGEAINNSLHFVTQALPGKILPQ